MLREGMGRDARVAREGGFSNWGREKRRDGERGGRGGGGNPRALCVAAPNLGRTKEEGEDGLGRLDS